jgi:hypothetical protein
MLTTNDFHCKKNIVLFHWIIRSSSVELLITDLIFRSNPGVRTVKLPRSVKQFVFYCVTLLILIITSRL